MLGYEELKMNSRQFLSLTSLTSEEFEYLISAFGQANLKTYPALKTMRSKSRKRKAGAGRKDLLDGIEQKLLFASHIRKATHYNLSWADCLGSVKDEQMSGFIGICRS